MNRRIKLILENMHIKNLKLSFIFIFAIFNNTANSANLVEPEDCILQTIQTPNSQKEDRGYIKKQCVKKFINQAKKSAKLISINLVSNATLSYGWKLFDGNGFIVNLKNNSDKRLISIVISIARKDGTDKQIFRLSAEDIIEPYSFGKFSEANPLEINQQYWDEHDWQILSIYGIDN